MKAITCPIQTIDKIANANTNIKHGNMANGLIAESYDLFKK